jgi:hypothetical protein
MAKYLVSAEQTVRRTKVFEAASAAEAEQRAREELGDTFHRPTSSALAWTEDDEQDGPQVLTDNTTEIER